jgi:signal peptidase I
MIVICKKDTKRLIKGVRYEVQNLWNDGTNQRWVEGRIEIKGIGRFVVDNFTDTNGNDLPKINVTSPPILNQHEKIKFEDIKKGDILVCTSDFYKTMIKNGMYRVEDKQENTYDIGSFVRKEHYIKFFGIKRRLKFNSWRFRNLTPEESREISLKNILDGEEAEVITTTKLRKIDMVVDKEIELVRILCKSILDDNRHHLSVIDWAIKKSGSDMSINTEDYEPIMNLTISQILEKLDK